MKTLCNKFGTKTRLTSLYEKLQVLKIDRIYKLEIANFMTKVKLNKLPISSASFQNFFVQMTSL